MHKDFLKISEGEAFNLFPVPCIITDRQGNILSVNRSYVDLFESKPDEDADIFDIFEFEMATSDIRESFENGDDYFTLRVISKNRDRHLKLLKITPFKNLYGSGVFINVCERPEDISNIDNHDSFSLISEKYVGIISSQINTPLSQMKDIIDGIKNNRDDIDRYIDQLEGVSEDYLRYVRSIIAIFRLNYLATNPPEKFSAQNTCNRLRSSTRDLAKNYNVDVSLSGFKEYVLGKGEAIEALITTALSRIVSITRPGADVAVSFKLLEEDNIFTVDISSSDVTIPDDYKNIIMNTMQQGIDDIPDGMEDSTCIRTILFIRSVKMLGGEVSLNERNDRGLSYCITFPIVKTYSDSAHNPVEKRTDDNKSTVYKRILVVDDIEVNRLVLCSKLSKLGFDVAHVDNGNTALDILTEAYMDPDQDPFDVVISDINMPGMSGIDLAEQIKSMPILENTVIIGMSAYIDRCKRINMTEAGMTAYIERPIYIEKLKSVLNLSDSAAEDIDTLDVQQSILQKGRLEIHSLTKQFLDAIMKGEYTNAAEVAHKLAGALGAIGRTKEMTLLRSAEQAIERGMHLDPDTLEDIQRIPTRLDRAS